MSRNLSRAAAALLSIGVLIVIPGAAYGSSDVPTVVYPTRVLSDNQYVFDYWDSGGNLGESGRYRYSECVLIMQSDGNLVLYGKYIAHNGVVELGGMHALWASNTMNRGSFATYQNDGNLVVYLGTSWGNFPMWASNTVGSKYRPLTLNATWNGQFDADGNASIVGSCDLKIGSKKVAYKIFPS